MGEVIEALQGAVVSRQNRIDSASAVYLSRPLTDNVTGAADATRFNKDIAVRQGSETQDSCLEELDVFCS